MKINTKLNEGGWVKWADGASFKLRPYPLTQMEVVDDKDFKAQIFTALKMFVYCVVDWKGLLDEAGKNIPCDGDTKQYMFDHCSEVRDFVMEELNKFISTENREQKN